MIPDPADYVYAQSVEHLYNHFAPVTPSILAEIGQPSFDDHQTIEMTMEEQQVKQNLVPRRETDTLI